jgi:hypothetical protein
MISLWHRLGLVVFLVWFAAIVAPARTEADAPAATDTLPALEQEASPAALVAKRALPSPALSSTLPIYLTE